MSAIGDLVDRYGDLKGELMEYAEGPRFSKAFGRLVRQRFGAVVVADEGELINFLDYFILQHCFPNGRTLVEQFLAERPDLPEAERATLLSWQDVVEGLFEVRGRDGEALLMVNLIDELTYRVYSNMGPRVFAPMRRGTFAGARLVPLGDDWLITGAMRLQPKALRAKVLEVAAGIALDKPELAFRNPDKLAQAWEIQREGRRHFIDYFGADLVIVAGADLRERMREYWQYQYYEARDAVGMIAAKRGRRSHGRVPDLPEFVLPVEMTNAETVAVIYDEVEGLSFYTEFGLVEAAFDNPNRANERRLREVVLSYLNDDTVSPLPLRRLAERDPDRASRLFQRLLKRPNFSWERDGEALLRKHKASHYAKPVVPRVAPVGGALLEHYRGEPDKGSRRMGATSRRRSLARA